MPSLPDFNLLGDTANLTNVNANVQQALLGDQQIQQNQNVLAQQSRENAARQAMAQIATTPNLDDGQFEQLLAPIAQADPNAALQMRRQRQMQRDLSGLMANPNARAIGRFGVAYPEALKGLKEAWDVMDAAAREATTKTSADVYGYLKAGDGEGAIKVLQSHMDAAGQTGEDTSAYPQLIDLIRNNPQGALTLAGLNLSLGMGHDKFADTYGKLGEETRANEKQPYEVRKSAAEATTAEVGAEFAPKKAASELATAVAQRDRWSAQTANEQADIALRRSGLDLERDKLQSTIQLELEKLDRSGTQLDANGRTAVNQAVGESTAASALADRMNNLANRMQGQGMGWGWMSSAREAWKGAFGSQDPISGLRSEYNQLVNAQAVKNLPPGPASDKDIALAKQGFPPANASGEYLQSFLLGMAKMQQAVAAAADRKANWIAANGSLAPSRRDIDVGGVMVPAGTTFTEFNGNAVKRGRQGETPASLDGILRKYGGR